MDVEPGIEKGAKSSNNASTPKTITLSAAIDLGEYNPSYLETFPEWHDLSPHIQWQFIRKALDIRQKQLITNYAELNNSLNLSQKPAVQQAMKNVEKQLQKLSQDREQLYIQYSTI
jgi:hypothetical protein